MTSKKYKEMEEITYADYLEFLKKKKLVIIEDVEIKLHGNWKIKSYAPSGDYKLERTTVWSFPDRGSWATHKGKYSKKSNTKIYERRRLGFRSNDE